METVGRVQPHVKAKLVDPKTGGVVEVGKPGEVVVAGYLLQKGCVGFLISCVTVSSSFFVTFA